MWSLGRYARRAQLDMLDIDWSGFSMLLAIQNAATWSDVLLQVGMNLDDLPIIFHFAWCLAHQKYPEMLPWTWLFSRGRCKATSSPCVQRATATCWAMPPPIPAVNASRATRPSSEPRWRTWDVMRARKRSNFLEIAGFHDFDSTFYIIDNTVQSIFVLYLIFLDMYPKCVE